MTDKEIDLIIKNNQLTKENAQLRSLLEVMFNASDFVYKESYKEYLKITPRESHEY